MNADEMRLYICLYLTVTLVVITLDWLLFARSLKDVIRLFFKLTDKMIYFILLIVFFT